MLSLSINKNPDQRSIQKSNKSHMKIQCDVCDKDEASLFCVADEAALCAACDHRVHHANKLAGKHQRFSLHHPSSKQAPLCDICQERKAFLFCHQDRAILCRECDMAIHKANEHTQKHTRYLLTGVKLSATCALYSSSTESAPSGSGVVPNIASKKVSKDHKPAVVSVSPVSSAPTNSKRTTTVQTAGANVNSIGGNSINNSVPGNSISEYLIEMLPGWHVEDLLESSFPSPYGFCKNGDNDVLPFWDGDLIEGNSMSGIPTQQMGFWVPQAPPPSNQSTELAFGATNGTTKEQSKGFFTSSYNNIKSSRKWSEDSSFVVPQITPSLSESKRLRTFW